MLFSVGFKLVVGFGLLAIIQGVFMQETFKLVATDNIHMLRQKEKETKRYQTQLIKLFSVADASGDGNLDCDEFASMMDDPVVRSWLRSMEFNAADVIQMFQLVDRVTNGEVSCRR